MKKLFITLFIIVLYVIFLCRPLALIHPFLRMWVFLILLAVQSMNTVLQFVKPCTEKILLNIFTGILNVVVLIMGMIFAFLIYYVFG